MDSGGLRWIVVDCGGDGRCIVDMTYKKDYRIRVETVLIVVDLWLIVLIVPRADGVLDERQLQWSVMSDGIEL